VGNGVRFSVTHRGDHAVEQLPCTADEWQALLIFVVPRALPDEDQVGVGVASREDALGPTSVEIAPGALGRFLCQDLQPRAEVFAPLAGALDRRDRYPFRGRESRAPQRFLPLEQLLGAGDDGRELVFRVGGHFGRSIGRFR
jgi:hypothetical protein